MADVPDLTQQNCPACGVSVAVAQDEPLARVVCPHCGEKFRVESAFDNFVLTETLGVGGMGSVYKARDTRLDRFVALKLLRRELSADPVEAARLEQEARVTAAVNHPHVVQVYSSGTAHGQIYLVMELVDHGSLDDLMAQSPRVPEAGVLRTGVQVAKGLQAAQVKGLIHRDVKPANILFSDAETAKIGDFGLAVAAEHKAEAQNEIWGTPYYVAPERLNNEPEDFRSDIYSLGATLFHALAGRPPMEGDTISAAELRELKSHPPDLRTVAPDVSRETAAIINRMLAPKPEDRFASYAELIRELERVFGRVTGTTSSRPSWLIPALTSACLLALTGGFFAWQNQAAKRNAKPVAPLPAATPENTAALQQQFDAARKLVLQEKYDQAASAFAKLIADNGTHQPLANWARLHSGLVALLQGKPGPARDAFQIVERAGLFSTAKSDAELAQFFIETSRTLAAPGPVRVASGAEVNAKSVGAFALFLYAMKDWQLSEFGEAAGFLEKFGLSQPPKEFFWVNDYKPLAQKFSTDGQIYAEWKRSSAGLTSVENLRQAVTTVKTYQGKLQTRGGVSDYLKEEEKRLTSSLAQREKSEKESREQERKRLLEKESPSWTAAMEKSRKEIAAYEFAPALATIESVQLSEPTLQEAQALERKRMQWLLDWKNTLVRDLNTGRYRAQITDVPNVVYDGVMRATDGEIIVRILGGKGSAPVKWNGLTPATFLAMSSAFFAVPPPETADRRWLSAVFAQASGQTEAARALADSAAKAKPAYAEARRALSLP